VWRQFIVASPIVPQDNLNMRWLNVQLVAEFVKRDFVERFAGSVLGSLWSLIWPLVNILIFTVIFSNVMNARLPGSHGPFSYSIYLISALLPWTAFATTVSRSTTVFIERKHILSKINVALPSMPFYINVSESITFWISLTFFGVFLIAVGHSFSIYHLMVPFVFLLQQLLAYALGLMLAVFTVFIRDLRELVGIVLQIWFWFTPIVYVKDILPEWVKGIIVYNPSYVFADSFQSVILLNKMPDVGHLVIMTVATFVLLLCSYFVYTRLESDVKDFL
jgi:homopolymeric O-antigen transport system permease protein